MFHNCLFLPETIHNWSTSNTFWVALNSTHSSFSSVNSTFGLGSLLQINVIFYQHKIPYILKNKGPTQGFLSDARGRRSANLDSASSFQSWIVKSLEIRRTADVIDWPCNSIILIIQHTWNVLFVLSHLCSDYTVVTTGAGEARSNKG